MVSSGRSEKSCGQALGERGKGLTCLVFLGESLGVPCIWKKDQGKGQDGTSFFGSTVGDTEDQKVNKKGGGATKKYRFWGS